MANFVVSCAKTLEMELEKCWGEKGSYLREKRGGGAEFGFDTMYQLFIAV